MNTFTTALKAEYIKKKGTGLFWLAVALGAFMPLLYAIVMVVENDTTGVNKDAVPYNFFTDIMQEMVSGYAPFFFPLFIIIAVSRITQTDHRNGGWQLMETQPVTRWAIYSSKLALLLTANLISILSLVVASYISGGIIASLTEVAKAATFGFEAGAVASLVLRLFVTGLFFTCLQYLISVLISSFVWSVLIGFFMLLGYLFLNLFKVLPAWYPVNVITHVAEFVKGSELGYPITVTELASVLLAVITVIIGFTWYRYKSFKTAFLGNAKRTGTVLCILLPVIALTTWMFLPNTTNRYGKTIISGKLEGEGKATKMYITDKFIYDTIAEIPLTDNSFHFELKKDIPLGVYGFSFNNSLGGDMIFGSNDSIYILAKQYGRAIEGKITGTRIAENSFKDSNEISYSMVQYYLQENNSLDNVDMFSNQLVKEWKDKMDETSKFRTADNYIPGDDFTKQQKQLATITYLDYWQTFVNKRKAAFPDKATAESAEIAQMKKTVPTDNESLLASEAYFNYIRSLLIFKDETDTDENTKALRAIAKLKAGGFKDKMLFRQLNNSLREANSLEERTGLMKYYAYTFQEKKYTALAEVLDARLNSIEKGKVAPFITASGLEGKPVNLADFKGSYVAIDVWATWCGPCREESPKFEKMAIKYKGQPIKFVALSTDRKVDDWFMDAKLKSKSVLQLHADDNDRFSKDYDIQFIPRFILIDKEGKIVNSKMPRPSEKTFEDIIRKELGLGEL